MTVTFVFPDSTGSRTGVCEMPWKFGWSVRQYFHEYPLRGERLLGMWHRCRSVNRERQKIRLTYVPVVDDVVVMSRVRR